MTTTNKTYRLPDTLIEYLEETSEKLKARGLYPKTYTDIIIQATWRYLDALQQKIEDFDNGQEPISTEPTRQAVSTNPKNVPAVRETSYSPPPRLPDMPSQVYQGPKGG